jgi:hypothetical protein
MEAILDLCLSPLSNRSAVGRPVWMEETVFSLPSSNFSIAWSLFYNSELIHVRRMNFIVFTQFKFR